MTSQTVAESWHEFTQETSMHGIRYVKRKDIFIIRRVIWGLTILGMLTYFCFAGYLFLDGYLKRSIKTRTTLRNSPNLKFPTVTICNRNYWKESIASRPDLPEEVRPVFFEIMKDIYLTSPIAPPPADKYNWSNPYLLAWLVHDKTAVEKLVQMAHTLEETFFSCRVKGIVLPCADILTQVITDAGVCYQFNANGSFSSHTAGLSGGVQFYMDTLTHEYFVGPFSASEGFSVAIHESDEVPLVTELSYGVRTGAHTSMIIQKKETKRVPPPADNNKADCFNAKTLPNPLHHYKIYSQTGCHYECLISHILKECGCVDFLHPPLNNSITCSVREMIYCATPAKKEYMGNAKYWEACNCTSKCEETQYTAKLSSYTFPSEYYLKTFAGPFNVTVEYAKKNYASVEIYYGQMSYELLEESIAYKITDMIANLGGTFGVCIGASLLTLMEFIEFLILTISRAVGCCTKSSNGKTQVKPFSNSADEKIKAFN